MSILGSDTSVPRTEKVHKRLQRGRYYRYRLSFGILAHEQQGDENEEEWERTGDFLDLPFLPKPKPLAASPPVHETPKEQAIIIRREISDGDIVSATETDESLFRKVPVLGNGSRVRRL